MSYTYEYPRPALTIDCVVFGLDQCQTLKVMLIQHHPPLFQDSWALPGGWVRHDESLDEAARRELQAKTGLDQLFLEQLYTFGAVDRDPRERVVTVAYYALVNLDEHPIHPPSDTSTVDWFSVDQLPPLIFDHGHIVATAMNRLTNKVRYEPIGFELLPRKFTLSQLQRLYERVLGRELDKRNFRKKVLKMGLLKELNEVQQDVPHRAAKLYSFDEEKYHLLKSRGFNFEI